jgi:hypothetical protein
VPSSSPVALPLESPSDPLVLVSDTSTEAERLIASLRARGFRVRDVPLMLMAARVESQHPNLVVCDGSSPKLGQALQRMRDGVWGQQVEVLLLGGDRAQLLESLAATGIDLEKRLFPRPIDVYSILQSVEELIGSPLNRPAFAAGVSMAALPRLPPLAARDSGQPRPPTPPPRRSTGPAPSVRVPPSVLMSSPETAAPGRSPSRPAPSDEAAASHSSPQFPVARVSRELEHLLENAEHKLGPVAHSLQPASQPAEHLSPEAELDAILPPDVLAALDEPLDVEEGDEISNPGTRPGEKARYRSNVPPSAPGPERDTGTGRSASKPGGTFAAVGTGSVAPGAPATLSGATPIPTSKGSFVPVPSILQHSTSVGESVPLTDSIPPSTVLNQPLRRGLVAEEDTDAPVVSQPSQRIRTEAEAAADLATPLPIVEDIGDQNSTAPPIGNHHRSLVDGDVDEELREPTRPPHRVQRGRSPIPRTTASPPARERLIEQAYAGAADDSASSVPKALGQGDIARALAELIRSRFSGVLVVEDDQGVRRIVLRDGDFVMVASGVDGESLVSFLIQRGDLSPDAARLERKLPQFGRHAGAALIAHGHLRQDELWPVLRAHAEWLLGRTVGVERGSGDVESELPARLQSEPAVFGGATGAEVLIETLRRVMPPESALHRLGGARARLASGQFRTLLNECALSSQESNVVEHCAGKTVSQVLTEAGSNDFATALYALTALGVLSAMAPSARDLAAEKAAQPRDAFDDTAIRSKIMQRRALVDEGDYFALLGVDREATGYEIRHAYLDLRREFNPSTILTAATAELRDDIDVIVEVLDEAYEVLRDSTRRERYRRALAAEPV